VMNEWAGGCTGRHRPGPSLANGGGRIFKPNRIGFKDTTHCRNTRPPRAPVRCTCVLHRSLSSYNHLNATMEVDSDADSKFGETTHSFVSWFQTLPGATFRSDLIAVEDLRGQKAGRGIGESPLGKRSLPYSPGRY